jgi:hypothetical protein
MQLEFGAIRVWNKPFKKQIDLLAGDLCNIKPPHSDLPFIFPRKS